MIDTSFLMGYGSWALARLRCKKNEPNVPPDFDLDSDSDYSILPMLSAEYSRSHNVPSAGNIDVDLGDDGNYYDSNEHDEGKNRSSIRLGSGVYSYSGNISFELTEELVNLFIDSKFLARRNFLDFKLCDGEGKIDVYGAVWSSFSISGSAQALLNCSLSFSSCNAYRHDIQVHDAPSQLPEIFNSAEGDKNFNLEPYWQYGGEGMESFSLSLSRPVTPVYLNEKYLKGPTYLRVGLMDVSFQITCWESWFDTMSLRLGRNKKIVFDSSAFVSQRAYSFAGIGGNGPKSYTLTALGRAGDRGMFEFVDEQKGV